MPLNTIWVCAEATKSALPLTLDSLPRPASWRAPSRRRVGADTRSYAPRSSPTGGQGPRFRDLGGALPRCPVAGPRPGLQSCADRTRIPDPPQHYDGRDNPPPCSAVKLDRPVLTNVITDLRVAGDSVWWCTAIFGGTRLLDTSSPGQDRTSSASSKVRLRRMRGQRTGEVTPLALPIWWAPQRAKVFNRHVEEQSTNLDEAERAVSAGRGLGEEGKYQMIESWRSCSGGARRVTWRSSKRLGALPHQAAIP